MTVEEIELRKILNQMLADNGINRETLKTMVNDIMEEKINKAIKQALAEKDTTADNIQKFVEIAVENHFRNFYVTQLDIGAAVKKMVENRLAHMNITMEVVDDKGNSSIF